ncbi:MAG: hypothetical protein RBT50_08730, partial [Bacteroidales bacterium]|nr:hypothetical protein [Bacteroidales bacterium]
MPENDLKNIPSVINSRIKSAPPIISYFQAITRMMINTKTGILCIRNSSSCLPKGLSPPKESKENNIITSPVRIARIRGNQYRSLSFIADRFYLYKKVTGSIIMPLPCAKPY